MQNRLLNKVLKVNGLESKNQTVTIPFDLFRTLLISALRAKGEFDVQYYISSNTDVREAVRSNRISSAEDHYYATGYFENRMPKRFLVDEKFYLAANPDVAEAVRKGKVKSGQEHFDQSGFSEGRAPFKDFSLF